MNIIYSDPVEVIPVSGKILTAEIVKIGNVRLYLIKGKVAALDAPGIGKLASYSFGGTFGEKYADDAGFPIKACAKITGGVPFNKVLKCVIHNAFMAVELAEVENHNFFNLMLSEKDSRETDKRFSFNPPEVF